MWISSISESVDSWSTASFMLNFILSRCRDDGPSVINLRLLPLVHLLFVMSDFDEPIDGQKFVKSKTGVQRIFMW